MTTGKPDSQDETVALPRVVRNTKGSTPVCIRP